MIEEAFKLFERGRLTAKPEVSFGVQFSLEVSYSGENALSMGALESVDLSDGRDGVCNGCI